MPYIKKWKPMKADGTRETAYPVSIDKAVYSTENGKLLSTNLGKLADLKTSDKTSVVAATNALATSVAPQYDASATYAEGAIVYHDGELYKCKTAITTAEAWTAAHWESKADVAGYLDALGRKDDQIEGTIASDYDESSTYALHDVVNYEGELYKCTTAITTAEAWTAAHWTACDKVAQDVEDLKLRKVTWSELKDLRDNSKLTPGVSYRITDYACTTTQDDTQSAGHQFDIIMIADDESTLNENARAIAHEGDTYFADCNLSAWEIKYTLDNDTTKFTWADDTNGKGVIFFMRDEWDNECHYDFKNIQFKRKLTDGALDNDSGTDTWVYTFNLWDDSQSKDATVVQPDECISYANVIGLNTYDFVNDMYGIYCLNGNVFLGVNDGDFYGIYANVFNADCYSNTFGNSPSYNTFGNYCGSNTFGNDCLSNTFGNYCGSNTFGNDCLSNTFGSNCLTSTFGNDCYYNTFGSNCQSNTFGNGCYYNTFGNYCGSNTFGNYCQGNTFGHYCYYNTFGNDCQGNAFGNNCGSNTFGNYCYYNTFGSNCQSNTFGTSSASKSYCRYIALEDGVSYTYLNCTATTSGTIYWQNVHINSGVKGTNYSSCKTITFTTAGNSYLTTVGTSDDTRMLV